MEFSTKKPWWMTDTYDFDEPDIRVLAEPQLQTGPHGVATVTVNSNGTTQPGWGLLGKKNPNGTRDPGFMQRYPKQFDCRKALWQYTKKGQPFAFVMRSMNLVCVDIDGKNGGFASTPQLGLLPPTLAETSKSGNGYHLFYLTDEPWDSVTGFNLFEDQINLAQGIDIRATGCVFHYPSQRWNGRVPVTIPDFLAETLAKKKARRVAARAEITTLKEMDDVDTLIAHDELLTELAKPLTSGSRNNTLFAIGSKMAVAGVPDWQDKIRDRAVQVGLEQDEADKLVNNIVNYN